MTGQGAEAPLVLVVDDHAPLRTLCRISLEDAGFRVVEAGDGDAALDLIKAERPAVILLDIMLPRVSGWRVAGTLLTEHVGDEIPIIFITALTSRHDRARALEVGGSDYLAKPFDASILPTVIKRVLDEIARGERDPGFAETIGALRAERILETSDSLS